MWFNKGETIESEKLQGEYRLKISGKKCPNFNFLVQQTNNSIGDSTRRIQIEDRRRKNAKL